MFYPLESPLLREFLNLRMQVAFQENDGDRENDKNDEDNSEQK